MKQLMFAVVQTNTNDHNDDVLLAVFFMYSDAKLLLKSLNNNQLYSIKEIQVDYAHWMEIRDNLKNAKEMEYEKD